MGLIQIIFQYISNNPELTIFFTTFLFGDEMVYFFSFLAGQGIFKLYHVIIFSILGNGLCDLFWFLVARSNVLSWLMGCVVPKSKKNVSEEKLIEKKYKKNHLFMLIASKFFYGTRLLTIFYVAKKEKSFLKIFFINSLAVFIWVIVVASVLSLIGMFTFVSFDSVENLRKIISLGVFIVLMVYILNKFVLVRFFEKIFAPSK